MICSFGAGKDIRSISDFQFPFHRRLHQHPITGVHD
jgi:hypothetical protein